MPRRAEPHSLVFFVDRSLGRKQVVEALRSAGAVVVVHDDVFPQSTTDVEWLGEAGQRGWVVLTKDATIRRNPPERRAVEAANVRMFVLTQQSLSGPEMAALFASALPGMRKRCANTPPPFIFSIAKNGSFSRLVCSALNTQPFELYRLLGSGP